MTVDQPTPRSRATQATSGCARRPADTPRPGPARSSRPGGRWPRSAPSSWRSRSRDRGSARSASTRSRPHAGRRRADRVRVPCADPWTALVLRSRSTPRRSPSSPPTGAARRPSRPRPGAGSRPCPPARPRSHYSRIPPGASSILACFGQPQESEAPRREWWMVSVYAVRRLMVTLPGSSRRA